AGSDDGARCGAGTIVDDSADGTVRRDREASRPGGQSRPGDLVRTQRVVSKIEGVSLTNAIPLPPSFLTTKAFHHSPVVPLVPRKSSTSPETGSLDSPDATERKACSWHVVA